jgi:signal transduction histidine kinase
VPLTDDQAQFDQRRLEVMVGYSHSLRVQMWLISAVIATLIVVGGGSSALVLAWLALFGIVRETRAAALVRLGAASSEPAGPRLRQAMWWSLALGATQGLAALFMIRLDTAYDALLSMVLMSLAAGAVSTTFTVVPAFNAYALGISVPTGLMWACSGGVVGWSVALLVALFSGVQLRFARQNMGMFEESYRIRQENAVIVRQLDEKRNRLAAARDIAVQADIAKSRFLASASHDLRQPLQSLSLNAGALARLPLPAEGTEIAGEIVLGLDALRQMLDTLLDVSKLDAGVVAPNFLTLPLDRLTEGLCARFRASAQAKGLDLVWDCPPGLSVVSDVALLQRVLSNLIDNAIKFTVAGGVTVRARVAGDKVAVEIIDTGIGIPADDIASVFDDLVQLDNPERDRSRGHGLGLGIVRRLVQLLGAGIEVDSTPGQGTLFRLRLPAAVEAGTPGAAVLDDGRRSNPTLIARRVLVLDDDPAVRRAYQHALQSLGCEVGCCATLPAALEALAALRPEVALVDYRLGGGINGLQAIARLRDAQPGLPAVIVSADTGAELRREAAPLGVPVLRKPVSEALLAMAINEALHGTH